MRTSSEDRWRFYLATPPTLLGFVQQSISVRSQFLTNSPAKHNPDARQADTLHSLPPTTPKSLLA